MPSLDCLSSLLSALSYFVGPCWRVLYVLSFRAGHHAPAFALPSDFPCSPFLIEEFRHCCCVFFRPTHLRFLRRRFAGSIELSTELLADAGFVAFTVLPHYRFTSLSAGMFAPQLDVAYGLVVWNAPSCAGGEAQVIGGGGGDRPVSSIALVSTHHDDRCSTRTQATLLPATSCSAIDDDALGVVLEATVLCAAASSSANWTARFFVDGQHCTGTSALVVSGRGSRECAVVDRGIPLSVTVDCGARSTPPPAADTGSATGGGGGGGSSGGGTPPASTSPPVTGVAEPPATFVHDDVLVIPSNDRFFL